ncbi:hypothetical protein PspLS_06291 [Pyricularia sp. CBS 133598]|nr:hypothetical protein PspLS_06291 [Pyricularia sp. CBS 133598]
MVYDLTDDQMSALAAEDEQAAEKRIPCSKLLSALHADMVKLKPLEGHRTAAYKASTIALSNASVTAMARNTLTPCSVQPPGVLTRAVKAAGSSLKSSTMCAVPFIAWAAMTRACSASNPHRTAPATSPCSTRPRKPGVQPAVIPAAFMRGSDTTVVVPTPPKTHIARAECRALRAVSVMTVVDCPTTLHTLGIACTTG